METLIVHPESKELLISVEDKGSTYNPEFVIKIQKSIEQIKQGQTREITIVDL